MYLLIVIKTNRRIFLNLNLFQFIANLFLYLLYFYRKQRPEIVIAVVACGMRLQETLNMLKSAIIFNIERMPLKFVIVTEQNLITSFKEKVYVFEE